MEMLTIKEAAKEFGLSEYELRIGIKQGRYPYLTVGAKGGKYLLSKKQLAEAIHKKSMDNMECKLAQ